MKKAIFLPFFFFPARHPPWAEASPGWAARVHLGHAGDGQEVPVLGDLLSLTRGRSCSGGGGTPHGRTDTHDLGQERGAGVTGQPSPLLPCPTQATESGFLQAFSLGQDRETKCGHPQGWEAQAWAERRPMPDPGSQVSQCQFFGAVVNSLLGLYFPHPCNGRSLSWGDWEGSLVSLVHWRSSHKPKGMCWR